MPTVYAQANLLQRLTRCLPALSALAALFARILPPVDRLVFRLTRRRHTLTSLMSGLPIVVLETTGARSGLPRTSPVIGIPDGDDVVVIASNGGGVRHPAWYANIRARPQLTIVVRGRRSPVVARETSGEERARLWARGLTLYPAWSVYERRAGGRVIPVVVLAPA